MGNTQTRKSLVNEKRKWCIWLKVQVFINGGLYAYHFVGLDVQLHGVVK